MTVVRSDIGGHEFKSKMGYCVYNSPESTTEARVRIPAFPIFSILNFFVALQEVMGSSPGWAI